MVTWYEQNARRCALIRKDVRHGLTAVERLELEHLESVADARLARMAAFAPTGPDELEKTVERLKREGVWDAH